MSRKAIRVLTVLAFSLYAAAMAIEILVFTVFRVQVLRLLDSPDVTETYLKETVLVPVSNLVMDLLRLAIVLVLMILVFRLRTDRGSRIAVIILAIALGVISLLNMPASLLQSFVIAHLGYEAAVAMTGLNTAIAWFTLILTVPAHIMLLLAMGGFCGRAGRLCEAALPESDNSLQGGTSE